MSRTRLDRVVAALCIVGLYGLTAIASPVSLVTPAGLDPGDRFRFLFVTSGTTAATSSDITTYDTFVNAQAQGATYEGALVSWKAIGSTPTVDARDHVGGFGTIVPVYTVTGSRLAVDMTTGTAGLWSGVIEGKPKFGIDGTDFGDFATIWSGSEQNGLKSTGNSLSDGSPKTGYTGFPTFWLSLIGTSSTVGQRMYGLSAEVTVAGVPEIDPAGMGSVLALVTGALGLFERRRTSRLVKA